ncbi:hypothetical protein Flavo103_19470 [Flavobacterium collinsii]|uniref:hypothetical protein n=1 Tax=Flavobacterium collinsii TaxID=1114861 RepID=UPI0022BAA802|nr:hypothetical protein [Flavobacterium collinsii]GIQ58811.1 hypothetical protein Flavo103_19470 [Flavobacterium collinsii]
MKQFYFLFLLFATHLTFGQLNSKPYDYFVQFNGDQLSKKVSIDEVLNHSLIRKYKEGKASLDLNKYAALFKLDQKITVHGNFTDSIPYYQVTIPIKNKEAVQQFFIQEHTKNKNTDSVVVPVIQDFGKYAVFTPKNQKTSFVWNDNYLVLVELTKKYKPKSYDWESTTQDSIAIDEPYQETSTETVEEPAQSAEEAAVSAAKETEEVMAVSNVAYEKAEADFNLLQAEQQSLFIKSLFENGFTAPVSEKVNVAADISSWLNYSSAMTSLNSAYSALSKFTSYNKFLPMQNNAANMVKGINLDFYFDNDNARIEEVVEYSEQMAAIVGKMADRKINKNIFNYFPDEKPLGYMSYHINTKAALEKFPTLVADLFQSQYLAKEDLTVVTDLISTIVDEEATATLFDGDLSMFLYHVNEVEVTKKVYGYDENYEEKITEEKVKKSVPLFSIVFTSTHPTFGDKLIQLGLRKKFLEQKGDFYQILGTEEYGTIFIKKDKDVVLIANTLDYFNDGKGFFVKEAKKDLKKNYISGKLNFARASFAYENSGKAKGKDSEKLKRLSEQFSDVAIQSPKRLIDNKLKFELKLNASKSDKNIILQTLDLAEELSK